MTLVFSSVTYALKAQRLLARHRIYTTLTRSAAVTTVRGCGYGLRLNAPTDAATAQSLLSAAGIAILGSVRE